jgi:pilus assembly protein Flp/PilA
VGDVMDNLKRLLTDILRDESGQDLVEYALVAALIAMGVTASMRTVATSIGTILSTVGSKLTAGI